MTLCGIAGLWNPVGTEEAGRLVQAMMSELGHRGPDAQGFRKPEGGGPVLGHTRLAIQDLTAAGNQPMTSSCGRFHIVLNGEIYNHWELRGQLGSKAGWRSRSDTETLVEAIAQWGLPSALSKANGMFALALWDSVGRRLSLARDRIGEKPLYWGIKNGTFLFASELAPILTSKLGPFELEDVAVGALMNLGYIPDPWSILRGIWKLEPAMIVEVRESSGRFSTHRQPYWRLSEVMERALGARQPRPEKEWIEEVDGALESAVRLRLISDVPVGAFLSGGVDSSLVVAMMSRVSSGPVRTFTVAMPGVGDESPRARALADHFGTLHTRIPISERDLLDVVPVLPRVFSEPLGDSSQVPTYLISQVTRRDVTVALSGDGGDELFAGYHRHFQARRIWKVLESLPRVARRGLALGAGSTAGTKAVTLLSLLLSGFGRREGRMLRIQKGGRLLGASTVPDLYRRLVTQWPDGECPLRLNSPWKMQLPEWVGAAQGLDPVEKLMMYDLQLALPGDMLVKVDRAAMAHALETRVPFLDHELLEVALRVPIDLKVQKGIGKVLLRRLLEKYAPSGWTKGPAAQRKVGFGIPLARWLRGDLRDWAEDLLSARRLRDTPVLDAAAVQDRWASFLHRGEATEHPLWSILMFQSWVREYRSYLELG